MQNFKLQDKFFKILGKNGLISNWLLSDQIDGVWFASWDHPEKFWMSEAFIKSLNFSSEYVKDQGEFYNQITDSHCRDHIKQLIQQSQQYPE